MIKKNILDSFQLKEGEKIVMQDDFSEQSKYNGLVIFLISLIGGILCFGLFPDLIIFIRFIILISFIILSVWTWDNINRNYRYTLLITNERAVRFPRKRFLPFKTKREEILIKSIDFIKNDYEHIIIVEKALNFSRESIKMSIRKNYSFFKSSCNFV